MKERKYIYVVCRDRETKELTGTVVAISSYAGKPVRGIAKCNPGDSFDVEFGKKLAAARCNLKIAQKRHKRAHDKYLEAVRNAELAAVEAKRNVDKMRDYFCDSKDAYDIAAEELKNIFADF